MIATRAAFAPGYFERPTLLAFCSENPIRNGRLPANIVDATRAVLEAGPEAEAVQYTLALVCSGRVPARPPSSASTT